MTRTQHFWADVAGGLALGSAMGVPLVMYADMFIVGNIVGAAGCFIGTVVTDVLISGRARS